MEIDCGFPVGKIAKKQSESVFLLIRHLKYSAILSSAILPTGLRELTLNLSLYLPQKG